MISDVTSLVGEKSKGASLRLGVFNLTASVLEEIPSQYIDFDRSSSTFSLDMPSTWLEEVSSEFMVKLASVIYLADLLSFWHLAKKNQNYKLFALVDTITRRRGIIPTYKNILSDEYMEKIKNA